MNYIITKLILKWYDQEGHTYTTINDIIGCLECVKQEFYRRVAISYEEKKIKENGDVY